MMSLMVNSKANGDRDNVSSPIAIDRFESEGYLELSEIGQCLSLEFNTPDDTDEVFRSGRMSLIDEMFFVLKRANPVTDCRIDSDVSDNPAAKRNRRSYDVRDEENDRDAIDVATLTSEHSQEYDDDGDYQIVSEKYESRPEINVFEETTSSIHAQDESRILEKCI